jgi:hypothetical protein
MISKRPATRKWFAKFLLLLFGFLLGLGIAEAALRAVGYSYPEFYQRDDVVGVSLLPGARGWYRREGEAYIRINNDGLRDFDHSLTKPANTFRIAVVGDSYCEALSVDLNEAFWSVMKTDLEQCAAFGGKQIEVINFGVSGYGTAQELLTLHQKVLKYSPDLVLLAMTTNNDITDNSRALKKTDDVPYFVYRGDLLTLDDSFLASRGFRFNNSNLGRFSAWWRTHSRVVGASIQGQRGLKVLIASWRAKRAAQSTAPPASAEKSDLFARADELGADNLVYLEPTNVIWNEAWRVTEGLLTRMRDDVNASGAKFIVVTLSNGPQVLPDPRAREYFMQRFGITDLFYPDHRIKSLGEREHIPVITLAPELQEYAQRNNVFLHGFDNNLGNGHWNRIGHRIAGQLIAKKICEDVLAN